MVVIAFLLAGQGCLLAQADEGSIFRTEKASMFQTDKAQLALVKAAGDRAAFRERTALLLLPLLCILGILCATWAQNDHRNIVLWFFAGFVFNIAALVAVFIIHRRNRRRRRLRRVISFWSLAQ